MRKTIKCLACDGSGQVTYCREEMFHGPEWPVECLEDDAACPLCGGTGKVDSRKHPRYYRMMLVSYATLKAAENEDRRERYAMIRAEWLTRARAILEENKPLTP